MKDYYIGLDLGSNSVGWAVSDEFYNLLRAKGKNLSGVRLFNEAKTAVEKRIFRSQRRLAERTKWRLELLSSLFEEEIFKIDPGFFKRLKDSKFYCDDKSDSQPNTLFNDSNFKDKDYHKKYPSIYHLRNELYHKDEKFDIRLIFLSLLHIVKKRGHFLFEQDNIELGGNFDELSNDLKDFLSENFKFDLRFSNEFEAILLDKHIRKKDKINKLLEHIEILGDTNTDNIKKTLVKLFVGYEESLKAFFPDIEFANKEDRISLSKEDFEEKLENLTLKLGDEAHFLEICKKIFDYYLLQEVMKGRSNISAAKVELYEQHKTELKELKQLVKSELRGSYNEIFKDIGLANYPAYVAHWKSKKDIKKQKRCTKDKFYKFLKSKLKNIDTTEQAAKNIVKIDIMQKIENGDFLPRLIDNNSVIPHQIHLSELEKILDNSAKHYPFLADIKDKIIAIFKFRIPFYVGPLNDYHKDKGGNAWIEKLSDERVLPWNFDKVVDKSASAKKFIERMINNCSYLKNEKVLAKNSLLYTRYCVLNEINKLKIDGQEISVELKQEIYREIFEKQKSVTKKTIKSYLIRKALIDKDSQIEGVDDKLTTNLKPHIQMNEICPELTYEQKENIIESISLFGYDKEMLIVQILRIAPNLNEEQLNKLAKLKYSGFGRLSRKLLECIKFQDKTLIQTLWESNKNLAQLVNDEFNEEIRKQNPQTDIDKLKYSLVGDLYVSPSVKRQIWQALRVVSELVSVLKHEPKKIFIEMARGEDSEKKRTKTRKEEVDELYKNIKKDDISKFNVDFKSLKSSKSSQDNLNSKSLYLYYKQLGKDIYTGDNINLADIYNANIYDLDHIIPRSIKKDDSLENLVLTNKQKNKDKSNYFPIQADIQNKMKAFWKMLKDKGLMGEKKYANLTRILPLSEQEKADFIARQLVETRQSTKAVAEILKAKFKNSEIIYVKAGNVSEFRQKFDLLKVRDINDLHHAQDAYLNIVIGNAYDIKFTKNPRNFIKNYENKGETYNLKIEEMLKHDIIRGKNFGWDSKNSLAIVKKVMAKQTPLISHMCIVEKGELFDLNAKKAKDGLIPLKKGDQRLHNTARYGGYSGKSMAYFFLVEYTEGKKRTKRLESVPIYLSKDIETKKLSLEQYCEQILGLIEPKIIIPKILKYTQIIVDDFAMIMTGNNKDKILGQNDIQLKLKDKQQSLIKRIFKELKRLENNKNYKINLELYKFKKDTFVNDDLDELYEIFIQKHKIGSFINRPSGQIKTLEDKREHFKTLSVNEKCIVLGQILNLFNTGTMNANLKLLGLGEGVGSIAFAKNLNPNKTYILVTKSTTGLYEKRVDLHKL